MQVKNLHFVQEANDEIMDDIDMLQLASKKDIFKIIEKLIFIFDEKSLNTTTTRICIKKNS